MEFQEYQSPCLLHLSNLVAMMLAHFCTDLVVNAHHLLEQVGVILV